MMRLFQVGDIRVYDRYFHDKTDLLIPRTIDSTASSFSIPYSFKKNFGFTGLGLKTKSFSFKDILFSTNVHAVHQRVSEYGTLMARPYVDVFAYIDRGECPETDFDENLEEDAFDDNLFWLHTTGRITNIDPDYDKYSIKVELDYQPSWEAVNRYFWNFSSNPDATIVASSYNTSDLNHVPQRKDLQSNMKYARNFYDDFLYAYDAGAWENWHLARPIGYPITGWGVGWTNDMNYSFTVDRKEWSVPPRSMYQWTKLPASGGITLAVQNEDSVWGTRETSAIVNLEELDGLMSDAGHTGLEPTDKLVIADCNGKNSFIIRGTEILNNVTPKWIYNSEYLGQTGFGYNLIQFSHPNDSVEVAHLHNFRLI